MAGYVIGADLGGTKIELGLVDPQDRIIARKRLPTAAEQGAASVVERIGLRGHVRVRVWIRVSRLA